MMKYLVVNGLDVNNRVAQEQGANGSPEHSRANSGGKVTQYWFSYLKKVGSDDYALKITQDDETLLSQEEQSQLLTEEEFNALDWDIDEDGDE